MISYERKIFPTHQSQNSLYNDTETPPHTRFLTYDSQRNTAIRDIKTQANNYYNCSEVAISDPSKMTIMAIKVFLFFDALMTLEYSLIQRLADTQPKITASYIKPAAYFIVSYLSMSILMGMHAYCSAFFVVARATYFAISNDYELSNNVTTIRFKLPKEKNETGIKSTFTRRQADSELKLTFNPLFDPSPKGPDIGCTFNDPQNQSQFPSFDFELDDETQAKSFRSTSQFELTSKSDTHNLGLTKTDYGPLQFYIGKPVSIFSSNNTKIRLVSYTQGKSFESLQQAKKQHGSEFTYFISYPVSINETKQLQTLKRNIELFNISCQLNAVSGSLVGKL
jgi:hypothetical protein